MLEEFLGKSEFTNHGERVVTGQRLMQAVSDIFLGWVHVKSGIDGAARDFYGRQLRDWKGSVEVGRQNPSTWPPTGGCAGGRWPEPTPAAATAIAIASYLGGGDDLRPRDRRVLEGLRTPERARPRTPRRGRQGRQDRGPEDL